MVKYVNRWRQGALFLLIGNFYVFFREWELDIISLRSYWYGIGLFIIFGIFVIT